MTKRLKSILDKYNSLRIEYFYAVTGDDPIATERLEDELNRLQTLIAGTQASNMLEREIKKIDRAMRVTHG